MNRTSLEWLFVPTPPTIYVGAGESERHRWIPSYFYSRDQVRVEVRQLRGWKMRTTAALMDEFAAALQFFDGFGENWYALEDCLSYLDETLPADAYVLTVERAEDLLRDEPEGREALFVRLDRAGGFLAEPVHVPVWNARGPVAFHVLLHVSPSEVTAVDVILASARAAGVSVRTDEAMPTSKT